MPNMEKKQALVQEIVEKLKNSQGTVLVDYCGLNVAEITELHNLSCENNIDYKVYKNTMVRFAGKNAGVDGHLEHLTGPNAIAFCDCDPVAAAKLINKFAKTHKALEIKAGIVEGKVIDVDGVISLAKLPPKEELVAKALGSLNAPIAGFVNVLNANIRGLAIALNQIAEQKQA